jgi:hypothetical protein
MSKRPVAELSDAELVDSWGDLQAKADKVDAAIKPLKAEFERRGLKAVIGARWAVLKWVTGQSRLDTARVKAEMGADWWSEHQKKSSRTSYDFTTVEPDAKPAPTQTRASA